MLVVPSNRIVDHVHRNHADARRSTGEWPRRANQPTPRETDHLRVSAVTSPPQPPAPLGSVSTFARAVPHRQGFTRKARLPSLKPIRARLQTGPRSPPSPGRRPRAPRRAGRPVAGPGRRGRRRRARPSSPGGGACRPGEGDLNGSRRWPRSVTFCPSAASAPRALRACSPWRTRTPPARRFRPPGSRGSTWWPLGRTGSGAATPRTPPGFCSARPRAASARPGRRGDPGAGPPTAHRDPAGPRKRRGGTAAHQRLARHRASPGPAGADRGPAGEVFGVACRVVNGRRTNGR